MRASISDAYRLPDRDAAFRRPSADEQRANSAATPDFSRPPISAENSANIWLHEKLEPYLNICYLNHGYNFFAPDPGPSLLIRYTVEREDGSTFRAVFPDLKKQWPRLRYHRHFMLSSHSWRVLPPEAADAYARHLLKVHNAKRITLELLEHRLLSEQEVLDGIPLDDPSTYVVLGTISGDAQSLAAPMLEETLPAPEEVQP
ncbi:MAG: hypothetical protein KDA42_12930 [Planctomycetales bacterium]|nr:hypothetical protein [Planctomycetales bacterium]